MNDIVDFISNVIIIFIMSLIIIIGMVIDMVDHNAAFFLIGGSILIVAKWFKAKE